MIIYFNLVFLYFMNPGLSSEVLDENRYLCQVMIKGNVYISNNIAGSITGQVKRKEQFC